MEVSLCQTLLVLSCHCHPLGLLFSWLAAAGERASVSDFPDSERKPTTSFFVVQAAVGRVAVKADLYPLVAQEEQP